MTDASASGDPRPERHPAASDVAETLSDLEHKLRALEIELSAVRRHPAPGPAERADIDRDEQAPPSLPPVVRLIDERLGTAGGQTEPAPAAGFARSPAVMPPPLPAAAPPPPPPATPPTPPASAPAQLIAQVRQRVAGVADQLEELMRLRRELELRAHELERGGPPSGAPTSSPPEAPAATSAASLLFEGHVELDVGPFPDTTALARFERTVAGLPASSGARVRGYGANRALIDVELGAPAALVGELRHALAERFTVLEAGRGRLSLVLESRGPGPAGDSSRD